MRSLVRFLISFSKLSSKRNLPATQKNQIYRSRFPVITDPEGRGQRPIPTYQIAGDCSPTPET